MLILTTYDIDTTTSAGVRRLARVAKCCLRYGVRVQASVFECRIDATQFVCLKRDLAGEINAEMDSVRFYRLGDNAKSRVETLGVVRGMNVEDEPLIF